MPEAKLCQWGNSRGVRIPDHILKAAGINLGDILEVLETQGTIVLKKKPEPKKELKAAGICAKYLDPALVGRDESEWKNAVEECILEKYRNRKNDAD